MIKARSKKCGEVERLNGLSVTDQSEEMPITSPLLDFFGNVLQQLIKVKKEEWERIWDFLRTCQENLSPIDLYVAGGLQKFNIVQQRTVSVDQ